MVMQLDKAPLDYLPNLRPSFLLTRSSLEKTYGLASSKPPVKWLTLVFCHWLYRNS